MKRVTAWFLAILMICSMLPVAAPAAAPAGEEDNIVLAPEPPAETAGGGAALPGDEDAPPSGEEEKPADGEEKPADGEEKPADGEEKPADGEEKPADGEEKPADGEEKPADGEEKPADGEEKPADGEEKPVDGEEKPADGEEKPADGEEKPADGEEKPEEGQSGPSDEEQVIYDEETGTYIKTEQPPELPNVPVSPEYVQNVDIPGEGEDPSLLDFGSFNVTKTAEITTAGSTVYYSWTPSISGRYAFESTNSSGDTYGYLYDTDWKVLASNDDGGSGLNFRIEYDFVAGTTYYFGAKWYSSTKTGPIYLCWRSVLPTATELSASSAATLSGVSATADITAGGEVKYYSITPVKTGTYLFESTNSSGDTYGYLYDSGWSLLASNDDGGAGSNFRISYTLTAGTTYYLGIKWYYSSATGKIDFCLRMQHSATAIDPADADSADGAACSAYLYDGAVAYYSFQPTRSGTYVFGSTGTKDTYGYLYSADWTQLAYDDDGGEGRNFRLTCSLTAGNTYYFGAKWYSANSSGTLYVTLKREEEKRILSFTPSAVSQGNGETLTPDVAQGELVYFSFTPAVSGSYVFASDTNGDTYGYLYDPDWTQLAYNDDGGNDRNFKITYALTAGRTYYFGAKWYSSSKEGVLKVNLSRDRRIIEINIPSTNVYTHSEAVSEGETVYFAFTPSGTEQYVFESVNTGGDSFCTLYDSNWGVLASSDDDGEGRNFKIERSLDAGTTYYYGVKWYFSDLQGVMNVRMRRTQPDLPSAIALSANAAATQVGTISGTEVAEGATAYFSLVPVESGAYIFETNNASGRIRGRLYAVTEGSLRELASNTGSEADHNCKITYDLTAGETYYYSVEWSALGTTNTISVILRKQVSAARLQPGVKATANITTGGAQVYFSFTPGTAGTYTFESTVSQTDTNKDTRGYLYDANMRQLSYNDDGGTGLNFRIDYDLEAGKTYYYGVKWYLSSITGPIEVILQAVEHTEYIELDPLRANGTLGETACANIGTAGGVAYCCFRPASNGYYVFESSTTGDTHGYLYDDKWQMIDSNDDGGNAFNFRIVSYLYAGKTYYYGVKWHFASTTGAIDLRLRRQFTVSFNANGGTVSTGSKTVVNGDTYGTLPTPSNGSKAFSGWYTSPSGGTGITSSTTVSLTGDQTLYAKWTANTVTVVFDPMGGSVTPSTKIVTRGNQYGTLPVPVRSGYSFTGWYTASTGGVQVTAASTVASNVSHHILYARWTKAAAVQPTGITVSLQNGTIKAGERTKATAAVSPYNASNKAVTWRSGNTGVATVDSSGNIAGVAAGTATITATSVANSGVRGSKTITVESAGGGKVSGYDPDFFYKFLNTESSFSQRGGYRIPVERYMQLGFSRAQANALYDEEGEWGGSCFGFSTSSILFYKNVLQEQKYDASARVPHDFNAPNGNSANAVKLRSMIELLQISQTMPGSGGWGSVGYHQPRFSEEGVRAAQEIAAQIDQGNPVKLGIRSNSGGHAVVIYHYTRSGNTYRFNIYDNSNFVTDLYYTSNSNYHFSYNSSRYTWYLNNYCTYDTIKAKYDQLKRNNYAGAANLLELNEEQTYTYLFCPAVDMTITDVQGHTAVVSDHELSGDMTQIQLILSEVPPDDTSGTVEPSYIIIFPTGEYTISGPAELYLAGQEIGVRVDQLTAGAQVTASADLKKIDIDMGERPEGEEFAGYSVTYLTYGELFDKIRVFGNSTGNALTASLYEDRVDVTGANLIEAQAYVSGKPAGIEAFTRGRDTVSVQWLELEDGSVTLWIGDLLQGGTDKDDKPDYWLENGIGANKDAILAERSQVPAPVPSCASGSYDKGQTLIFTKDDQTRIYYTTDGSTPSKDNGEVYPGFIEINRSMKICAIAVRDGYLPSEVVELDYELPEVSKPAASCPDGQMFKDMLYVDLFSASENAEIYYTLDGTDPLDPTSSPERYSCAIPISSDTVLAAVAIENGCVSEVARYTYSVEKTFTVTSAKLLGRNGQVLNSSQLSGLDRVELTVSNSGPEAKVNFTVAFYTGAGQLVCLTSQEASAASGSLTTVSIPVAEDVSRGEKVKIFLTDGSYRPLGYFKEL